MQPWFFQDFLQGVSMTERQDLGRGGDLEMGAKATARTDTGQREEWCSGHTAASPRVRWQHPLGERQGLGVGL